MLLSLKKIFLLTGTVRKTSHTHHCNLLLLCTGNILAMAPLMACHACFFELNLFTVSNVLLPSALQPSFAARCSYNDGAHGTVVSHDQIQFGTSGSRTMYRLVLIKIQVSLKVSNNNIRYLLQAGGLTLHCLVELFMHY